MEKMIFGMRNSLRLSALVARKLKAKHYSLLQKNFPDGESYIRFPADVSGKSVVLIQSLHPQPSESLTELYFAICTARELGARHVTAVVPYLAYMRQDKMFNSGECVSSHHMGRMLSAADEIITIDPHLHRYKSLSQVFACKATRLTANSVLSEYLKRHFSNEVVIGPDVESQQWSDEIARAVGLHAIVLKKKRYTSRSVHIKLKRPEAVSGRDVVIVDDIISSGHTMIETIKQTRRARAKRIYCLCVHGIYAENAFKKIMRAGAREVISTNTIQSSTAKIDVSGIIAAALR